MLLGGYRGAGGTGIVSKIWNTLIALIRHHLLSRSGLNLKTFHSSNPSPVRTLIDLDYLGHYNKTLILRRDMTDYYIVLGGKTKQPAHTANAV